MRSKVQGEWQGNRHDAYNSPYAPGELLSRTPSDVLALGPAWKNRCTDSPIIESAQRQVRQQYGCVIKQTGAAQVRKILIPRQPAVGFTLVDPLGTLDLDRTSCPVDPGTLGHLRAALRRSSHPAAADTAKAGEDRAFLELCRWCLDRQYVLREGERQRVCVIG